MIIMHFTVSEQTWAGVVYYIRNNLSYDVKSFFFKLLLPNTKAIVVGIIYRPPSQSNFLEIINTYFSKFNTHKNEIYIPDNFNINLYCDNSCIFQKIIYFSTNWFLMTSKNTMNSVQSLALNN